MLSELMNRDVCRELVFEENHVLEEYSVKYGACALIKLFWFDLSVKHRRPCQDWTKEAFH